MRTRQDPPHLPRARAKPARQGNAGSASPSLPPSVRPSLPPSLPPSLLPLSLSQSPVMGFSFPPPSFPAPSPLPPLLQTALFPHRRRRLFELPPQLRLRRRRRRRRRRRCTAQFLCVCVCVCVWARARARLCLRVRAFFCVRFCACVRACVRAWQAVALAAACFRASCRPASSTATCNIRLPVRYHFYSWVRTF